MVENIFFKNILKNQPKIENKKYSFLLFLEALFPNVTQPLLQPCHLVPVSECILMLELFLVNFSSNPVT